ncbi:hypothetical protein H4Q26_012721 [Puccinia striiformis f. sp. tritici PST-130]|nr:hypothetical protein H4Q26_012721 [Puccinia striiformis f. sp. tritici PST-130]
MGAETVEPGLSERERLIPPTPTFVDPAAILFLMAMSDTDEKATDSVDEIDQALQELKIKPQPQKSDFRDHHAEPTINNLLKVDPKCWIQISSYGECLEQKWFHQTQSRFLQAILSADPNQLVTILKDRPIIPIHYSNYPKLDFKAVENRGFFKALDRKVLVLLKQGCYRSSFQTSKFLFSLNPYQDPLVLYSANQDQFFIDFLDNLAGLQDRDPNGGIYVEAYPGLYYARALCMRAIEEKDRCSNHDQSDFALESAILRFPQVLKPLSRAIGISLPSQYERIERAEVEEGYVEDFARNMLHLKARIYATRSSSLWKVDEISSWLRQILNRVVDKFAQSDDPDVQLGTQFETDPQLHSVAAEGIYRAVLVSDVQAFKNFLPPSVYSRSTTAFSFDPLPPVGGTTYDGEYFKITTEEEEQEQDSFREAERRGRRPQEEDDEDTHEGLDALFDVDHDDALLQPDQVDHLVAQIQFLLQLDNDQLSPDQRLSLLARLDRLLLLRPVFPDPNLLHDHQVEASADEGVPRMPGAF